MGNKATTYARSTFELPCGEPFVEGSGTNSLPPLERRLVVGEATGMMTFDKRQMVLFLELRFRPTTDSHLGSGNGGRID